MKSLLKLILPLILSAALFSSCRENSTIADSNSNPYQRGITKKEIKDKGLIRSLIRLENVFLKGSNHSLAFDNTYVLKLSPSGRSASVLFVNHLGFDKENSENYGFAAAVQDGKLYNPVIVKTSRMGDHSYRIDYYKGGLARILSIELDRNAKSIKVNKGLSSNDCGEEVAACMADAYTAHGWASVALMIESAFIPETTVAVAALCITDGCPRL